MKGRGYVENGHLKAAKYIAKEFKKFNLSKYNEDYFQYFTTPINTQPGKITLNFNTGEKLIPGENFLINPSSPSIKGTYETSVVNISDLLDVDVLKVKLTKSQRKVLLIDIQEISNLNNENANKVKEIINFLSYSPSTTCTAIIVFTKEKLTWSGSTQQLKTPVFTVSKPINSNLINSVTFNCESKFYKDLQTQNIIGYIEGSSKLDSTILISAHYDHLGMMGKKTIFPGANDNASGVALLLNLARHYSAPENLHKYNLAFIAFGAEEIGLIGSKFYTENPVFPLENIKLMINFDLAGTGDDGIKVVNATLHKKQFNQLTNLNKKNSLLKKVSPRGPACNSDHCFFHENNIPCFYIYTLGGIKAYHDIYDKYETLPFTEFENYSTLMKLFIDSL